MMTMPDKIIYDNLDGVKELVSSKWCAYCSQRTVKLYYNPLLGTYFRCDRLGCKPSSKFEEVTLEEYEVLLIMDE